MTSIFLMATKNFPTKIEIALKNFQFFFQPQSNFVLKQTFSKKKYWLKILTFCLHKVVMDTQK